MSTASCCARRTSGPGATRWRGSRRPTPVAEPVPGGCFGRALVVDVTDGSSQVLDVPSTVLRQHLGGVGLGTWLLTALGPPGVDALAHHLEQGIADTVSEGVVDKLEAIQVQEQDGHQPFHPPRLRHGLLYPFHQQYAVGQAG